MTTRFLLLTKDGRFAYLDKVIGGKGVYTAEEWGADRAMRFLMQHGEADIVDEFPDIFRKRRVVAPPRPRSRRLHPRNARASLIFSRFISHAVVRPEAFKSHVKSPDPQHRLQAVRLPLGL